MGGKSGGGGGGRPFDRMTASGQLMPANPQPPAPFDQTAADEATARRKELLKTATTVAPYSPQGPVQIDPSAGGRPGTIMLPTRFKTRGPI